MSVILGVVGMVRREEGACRVGYSMTVVGLIDRGWSGGGRLGTFERDRVGGRSSFGATKAAAEAVVSGKAAKWASVAVGLFWVAGTVDGG